MKKMIKKLLPIILIITILSISIFPVNAVKKTDEENVVESNIETFFHENSGTLIVSGTGEVRDLYPRETKEVYCDTVVDVDATVKHLVIDEGITSISNAFNDLHNLQDVLFPETLVKMEGCFNDCDKLKSVDFPSSLRTIGSACFNDCDGIEELHLNDDLEEINYEDFTNVSFYDLDSLRFLELPGVGINGAFSECSNLKTVYHADPLWFGGIGFSDDPYVPCFMNCADDITIYAPKSRMDYFFPEGETDDDWSDNSYDTFWAYHLDVPGGPNIVNLDILPSEVKMSNGVNGIELSWDCLRRGVTYTVKRNYYGEVGATRTGKFVDTGLKSGKEYSYSIYCGMFKITTETLLYLARPELKSVVSSSSKTATVKWNKVEGAEGYYVYRSATGEAGTWTRIANIKSGSTTSYTAKDLKKGSDYYFCVKAYSGTTASASSAKKVVTVGEPVISASVSDNGKITVKWNKISDVAYYRVYIKNKGVPSYTTAATIKNPSTVSYSGSWKFDSQNTACVRVRAFYKDGTHQISDPIEVMR